MTQWISEFAYPAAGWLSLAIDDPEGAERAAREVAARDGEGMEEYAEAVYPELKQIWENMRERRAAPVAVYVPPVPLGLRPLVPVSAYIQARACTPEERTLEALDAFLREPHPHRYGEADIAAEELPAGPACRVHEVLLNEPGDDERQFVIEHIDWFVLPPECAEGMFKFSVSWSSLAISESMIDTARDMAQSLTVLAVEDGETPPVAGAESDTLAQRAAGPVDRESEEASMTQWVPRFDYPASEWLWLDVNRPDGAEQLARGVAARGGRRNKRYAKDLNRELSGSWAGAAEDRIEPLVVYVPDVMLNIPPLSPASINARLYPPEGERSLEALMAKLLLPPDPSVGYSAPVPEVTAVELPIGPACRAHVVVTVDTGFGEQVTTEYVQYHVLPEALPDDVLLLHVFWVQGSVPGMVELADRVAGTLTLVPRGSGEEAPRPVLAAGGAPYVLFDEVQIGKGLRPLSQHGFVTIEGGVLSLLGSDRAVLASAPVTEVTAWSVRAALGTAVGLEINGTTYNAAPGRGSYPKAFTLPTDLAAGHSAADQLLHAIEAMGGKLR